MAIERKVPGEIRIFLNHVYEFKKGVRNMVLYTMNKEHEALPYAVWKDRISAT